MSVDGFVQLNRTFSELPLDLGKNDEIDIESNRRTGNRFHWVDITREYRVIVLAEAGAGKTEEIRHIAQSLRGDGKAAFFLRLENIANHFELAFEIGSYGEFEKWLSSIDEGWLFLDSVDEARLRNPADFDLAVRTLGQRIVSSLQRVHIVVTGRPHAWRPKSDLTLCMKSLPYEMLRSREATEDIDNDRSRSNKVSRKTVLSEDDRSPFKVVAIDDLNKSQAEAFVLEKGISNAKTFLDDVEKADAWSFTTRPQDLQELAGLWVAQGRIGSRSDIVEHSIVRRLSERDQGRADVYPLAPKRAREGAMLIAAAVTLTRQSSIRIPDGSANSDGLSIADILSDWDDRERTTLLSRPIFDPAIYGTVRFHHRSVREYLTADWIAGLLNRDTSRRGIENLLFRCQYGVDIITPTMRPILPWLALADSKVLSRIQSISPELLLEEGDPSKLPLETRRRILGDTCCKITKGELSAYFTVGNAVQRFAKEDIAVDVKHLLKAHASNDDLVWFLLRMIWIGELRSLIPEAKEFALASAMSSHSRTAAIRALQSLGCSSELQEVRKHIIEEGEELDRRLLAELSEDLVPTPDNAVWLLDCVAKAKPAEPYHPDGLEEAVVAFVQRASVDLLPTIVISMHTLFDTPPFIERRHCEISERFCWLVGAASHAISRLIKSRHLFSMTPLALDVVLKIKASNDYSNPDKGKVVEGFDTLIPAWTELNRAALWHDVENIHHRNACEQSSRETDIWQVRAEGSYWAFESTEFEYLLSQVTARTAPHEKMIALSLAFFLYKGGGRVRQQRVRMKRVTKSDATLSKHLASYLKPAKGDSPTYRRKLAAMNRRHDTAMKKQSEHRNEWRAGLQSNPECLRHNGLKPGVVSEAQWYVHQRAVEKAEGISKWTTGDWKCLYEEFGEDVAIAYRDGVTHFWRQHQPQLRSEGAPPKQTPFTAIFGLTGLAIEAGETADWASTLTESEVALACRYATYELNGFPAWFPTLFQRYPTIVGRFLLKEIRFELSTQAAGEEVFYTLHGVSSSGRWAWDTLAPDILSLAKKNEPVTLMSLGNMLTILNGSTLADVDIANVASRKCQSITDVEQQSLWFAVWVGVDPEAAIGSLERHLAIISDSDRRTGFAMRFITDLYGGHRAQVPRSRARHHTPEYLKRLYLLMYQHIRLTEDIHRSGGYTPTIRDDAQRARDEIAGMIRRLPGKESFDALTEISEFHTDEFYKSLYSRFARERAEVDADMEPWTAGSVREFHEKNERTPRNHTELAELTRFRLLDLKDDLEDGDSSDAELLLKAEQETTVRKFIGQRLRDKASGRYSIPQEEELADAKRPDLRFHGNGFDGPVPCELKLVDKGWSGVKLFERLENQLCGDYLRDVRSARGFYILVYQGKQETWTIPGGKKVSFQGLVQALEQHWLQTLSKRFTGIDSIEIIGIDLTKRSQ